MNIYIEKDFITRFPAAQHALRSAGGAEPQQRAQQASRRDSQTQTPGIPTEITQRVCGLLTPGISESSYCW